MRKWTNLSRLARRKAIEIIGREAMNAGARAKSLEKLADGYRSKEFSDEHVAGDDTAVEEAAKHFEVEAEFEIDVEEALEAAIGELPLESEEAESLAETLNTLREGLTSAAEEVSFAELMIAIPKIPERQRRELLFELLRDEARRADGAEEATPLEPEPDELAQKGAELFAYREMKGLAALYGGGSEEVELIFDFDDIAEIVSDAQSAQAGYAQELAEATGTDPKVWTGERIHQFADTILDRWRSKRGPRNYGVIDAAEGFESVKEILDDHGFDVNQDTGGEEPAGVFGVLGALVDAVGLANTAQLKKDEQSRRALDVPTLILRKQTFSSAGLELPGRDLIALRSIGHRLDDAGLLELVIPPHFELEVIDRAEIEKEALDHEIDGELLAGASDELEDETGRAYLHRLAEFSVEYGEGEGAQVYAGVGVGAHVVFTDGGGLELVEVSLVSAPLFPEKPVLEVDGDIRLAKEVALGAEREWTDEDQQAAEDRLAGVDELADELADTGCATCADYEGVMRGECPECFSNYTGD